MVCQNYNSNRHRQLRSLLAVALLLAAAGLSKTASAQQWPPDNSYGFPPPQQIGGPVATPHLPPVTHESVAHPMGPAFPPLVIEQPRPTITNFPPALTGPEVTATLDEMSGQLRVIMTEDLLNCLLARQETDAGPVVDYILGANVSGQQNTETELTVDVEPSQQTARLQLRLSGTTCNETVGVTPQAAVRSRGTHQFLMTKQIDFDGSKFTTRSPAAWVTPQLTHEGAATRLTGVPLIGPLANRIALSEAERRRPVAEQIITQRVTEGAAPRFNQEVDQQLSDANVHLQEWAPRALALAGLTPQSVSFRSTDQAILFSLAVPGAPVLPGTFEQRQRPVLPAPAGEKTPNPEKPPTAEDDDGFVVIRQISNRAAVPGVTTPRDVLPPPAFETGKCLTVAVHEELLNYAIRRASIGGVEIADRTIDRVLEMLIHVLAEKPLDELAFDGLGHEEPEFATLKLVEDEPIAVRFDEGEVRITAVAGFAPLLTPEVPPQRIDIRYELTCAGDHLTLQPGEVTVEVLPGAEGGPMVELARPIIQQQVSQRLLKLDLPTTIPLDLPDLQPLTLKIRDVKIADGWLLIAID